MSESKKITLSEKWLCLLTDPPYTTPFLDQRLSIVRTFLDTNENVQIILFFYLDGIHQLNSDQFPRNVANIGAILTQLYQKYPKRLTFCACSRCTAARGYIDLSQSDLEQETYRSTKLLPFVHIVSIREFGAYLAQGYRCLQI